MVSLKEIEQAREQFPSEIIYTPLMKSSAISDQVGGQVSLKAENLQVTGSYKTRAAFTILSRLSKEQKRYGAAISSSGNFATAFAFMGSVLKIPTAVVMMEKTSPYKVSRTKNYGGEVVLCQNHNQARWDTLRKLSYDKGLTAINTWEDENVIRGHGSIGSEIIEQMASVDVVIVPVSSGGLIGGIATAVKSLNPSVKIIGVQPEGSQAVYQSFLKKEICELPEPNTVCDSLVAPRPGKIPFDHLIQYVDDMVLVSDKQAIGAVKYLISKAKLVVEPGGAVGVAAALNGVVSLKDKKVVILLSGGNIEPQQLAGYLVAEP